MENQPFVRRAPIIFVCLLALPSFAEEGLWPYNQFPKDTVKQKYSFDVDAGFLDHLRLASVKIGGGSASFVSPNGLLLTNRHLAGACLAQHDYFRDGFQASNQSAELRCPGLNADVLLKIDDVSEKVRAAGQSLQQRNAAIAAIEKNCGVCSVVRLFSGGRYDLY